MRHPPLHRQIFFWTAFLAFLVIAPSVVFYTAGYRWNPKKGVIERNGTLIVDTTPAGARITLNGQVQEKPSPLTIKNLAPGTYQIDVSLNGYHAWSKTLQMLPERVTFANGIVLWLQAEPRMSVQNPYGLAIVSPNGKYVVAVKQEGDANRIALVELSSGKETVTDQTESNGVIADFEWSDDSSAVLVSKSDASHSLILRRDAKKMIPLPTGVYRWENGMLIGSLEGERYVYDVSNDTTQRDALGKNINDVSGNYQIIAPTGTRMLALIERGGDVRFDLPSGDWRFASQSAGYVYLRSGDEWLSFDPDRPSESAIRFRANVDLKTMSISGEEEFLSRYGGELSLAKPGKRQELLVRKSDSIVGASWHESGKYVLYATTHDVIAFDLDSRDHRIETVLASFDEITGFSYQKREAVIVGTKNGQTGIWKLLVQ
jgi:hypothetical protein